MKNSERTEKKLKNLKPFQKGKSGNPNGRPKKLPELDELLKDILLDETNGKTQIELIVRTLVKQSLKGDIRASEILLNRSYGKVKESIELEQKNESRVVILQLPDNGRDDIETHDNIKYNDGREKINGVMHYPE